MMGCAKWSGPAPAVRRRAAAGFLPWALASGLAGQEPAPAGPEVEAVRFVGAHALDHDLLAAAIATRPTTCRTPLVALPCLIGDFDWAEVKQFLTDTAQVAEDAERLETLYEIWAHPDATAAGRILPQDDGDVIVEFTIDEGRPLLVRTIDVRGLDAVSPPIRLPALLPLRRGEPYALPRLESMTELLQRLAAERAHPYAEVEVTGDVDDAAYEADLVLTLLPGPRAVFGATSVRSEQPIAEKVVRSHFAHRAGDAYAAGALDATTRLLYDLPIVERAVVQPVGLLEGDSVIEVAALVEARRASGVDVEGTLSTTECLAVSSFWRHRYFLGGPRVLGLGASVSNLFAAQADGGFPCGSTGGGEFGELDHALEAELWHPSVLGDPRTTARVGAFIRRQSSPNAWIERGWGVRAGLSHALGAGLDALLDYRLERTALEASAFYFCGNYGVCGGEGIDRLSEPTRLAPVQTVVRWSASEASGDVRPPDRSPGTAWDPVRVPAWRWSARIALEGAADATGSQYGYGRALLETSGARVFGRVAELVARVRAGAISGDDVLPPQVRLYSGGVSTVRGAEQNLLGPKVLVTSSDGALPAVCDDAASCDLAPIDPARISVRPTGGDRVLEANIEARWWLASVLQLAAFLDYGRLERTGGGEFGNGAAGELHEALFAPGVGVRLITDLGPIRVDIGYDASGPKTLPLLTDDGTGGVRSAGYVRFDPFEWDDPGALRAFVRRLQLHMAIGQAF